MAVSEPISAEQGARYAELRKGALAAASRWVDDHSQPEQNGRGYPRDGWKPPTLTEKAETVLRIAEWLLQPPPSTRPALVPPVSPSEFPAWPDTSHTQG
jgi:hypothetical protein